MFEEDTNYSDEKGANIVMANVVMDYLFLAWAIIIAFGYGLYKYHLYSHCAHPKKFEEDGSDSNEGGPSIVMIYIAMIYIVKAYMVMAYIVMAYIVMAYWPI